MGFRFRKSVKLPGGVRVNFSKSGVGYSVGSKGYRVTKTAKGTTRTTASIPGTGISYVEETKNTGSTTPEARPSGSGCLVKIIGIPLAIILAFFIWFAVFREAEEPNADPPATISAPSNVQIMPKSEDQRAAEENAKTFLQNAGFEIIEARGTKFTVACPELVILDASTPPENWEDVRAKFLNASNDVSEELGESATLYLYDNDGNHYLTAVNGKETYSAFDAAPSPGPSNSAGYDPTGMNAMVWVSDTGRRYHSDSTCSGLENPQLLTRGEALSRGYTACSKCH